MSAPIFHRIAKGDYETDDGLFRLTLYASGWAVLANEDLLFDNPEFAYDEPDPLIIRDVHTKREAEVRFDEWYGRVYRNGSGQPEGTPSGLREELALAQQQADDYEREAADLWRRGHHAESERARRRYDACLRDVRELQRRLDETTD